MHTRIILTMFFLAGVAFRATGQVTPPTVNGIISPSEYGMHINGANIQSTGASVWYMTWTADSLYIGITAANANDAAILYFDLNPLAPINGGTSANGSISGRLLDNTNFDPLPFRADRIVYCKPSQREVRSADGAGGWNPPVTSVGSYAAVGTTREIAIPWTALGGMPPAFAWFGYITNSTGSVYAGVPFENQAGAIGVAARFERYYTVGTTAIGNATWPFSQNCFVFNGAADSTLSGNLNVHDLTMNSPGRTLYRATNTSTWIVTGTLRADAGTISFGDTYGSATVHGNVLVAQGSALALSGNDGGDLFVKGNLDARGTFTAGSRIVTFFGSTGSALVGDAAFHHLTISKSAGAVVEMAQAVRVHGTLALISGNIRLTGTGNLTVASGGDITGGATFSYVVTAGTGWLMREAVGNDAAFFPIGTESSFNPIVITNAGTPDKFRASVKAELDLPVSDPQRVVTRQWSIAETVPGGSTATVSFQWNVAEHGTAFNPAQPVFAFNHTGTQWTTFSATVTGNNPYTATVGGLTQFNKFILGNSGATSVAALETAPNRFALHQNYPNPFNPSTEIKFSVENTDRATLEVYNLLGQKVATLFDGIAEAGQYHRIRLDGSNLSSGIYFYRLQSGTRSDLRKMILMK